MTKMGRAMDTTLFVKNGPCMAALGLGGEGYLSFSIATPTGEGVTTPLTFTRERRCSLIDDLCILGKPKRLGTAMQLGLVVGTATSTVKHASLRGQKLLVVQPLMADGKARRRRSADGGRCGRGGRGRAGDDHQRRQVRAGAGESTRTRRCGGP